MLSNHPGTRTGTQSKFRFSFFLLFVSFFFLFHFFTCGYPKGFVMGFNIQMCHLLTLCWQRLLFGSRTHGPISKQHSSLLPKGPWVVYSLMHPGPWENPGNEVVTLTFSAKASTLADSSLSHVYVLQVSWS